jgi:tetratricopeptide (TPR) repeat protein
VGTIELIFSKKAAKKKRKEGKKKLKKVKKSSHPTPAQIFDIVAHPVHQLHLAQIKAKEQRKVSEAECLFQQAWALEIQRAEESKIIEAYEACLKLNPQSTDALVNLGTIWYNKRDYQEAERLYTAAIEIDPNCALAHYNLGNLHDELGRKDEAIASYKRAIEIDPKYADPHYNLALLLQKDPQTHMQAIKHWRAHLKLEPNSIWSRIAGRELNKLTKGLLHDGRKSVSGKPAIPDAMEPAG